MGKETWSKEEGFDLRWDKRTILVNELKAKGGATTTELPKIPENQVHALKESHMVYKFNDETGKAKSHKKLKAKIFKGIASLYGNEGISKMCKRLRKLEGMVR